MSAPFAAAGRRKFSINPKSRKRRRWLTAPQPAVEELV